MGEAQSGQPEVCREDRQGHGDREGMQCHGVLRCAVNVILFYEHGKRSGKEQVPREMGDEAVAGRQTDSIFIE